jgi:hypothetical protein
MYSGLWVPLVIASYWSVTAKDQSQRQRWYLSCWTETSWPGPTRVLTAAGCGISPGYLLVLPCPAGGPQLFLLSLGFASSP